MTEYQMQDMLDTNEQYNREYFVWCMDESNDGTIESFFESEMIPYLDERTLALMDHLDCTFDEAEAYIADRDWLVLTDDEADKQAASYAESSLDDALYHIPTHLRQYFDNDAYIEDYIGGDRGSLLGHSDGNEYYVEINGTTYYLYNQS